MFNALPLDSKVQNFYLDYIETLKNTQSDFI